MPVGPSSAEEHVRATAGALQDGVRQVLPQQPQVRVHHQQPRKVLHGQLHVQRSPLFCAPGLVKFVPAVARLSCLALPE